MRFAHAVVATLLLAACTRAPAPQPPAVTRSAEGDGATMKVTIDRDHVEAGQVILLTIETTGSAPPTLPTEFGLFEVRPVPEPIDAKAPADAPRRSTFALTTLESGSVEIPAIDLPLGPAPEGGAAPTLRVEPIKIEVASLLGGDEDPKHFRDVKGVVELKGPVPWSTYVAIAITGVLLLAAVVVLVAWLRRPKRPEPELPAHERALRDLSALEAKRLPAAGRVHEYFVSLSDVVRHYIERRYGIRAPELTTPEFLRESRRARSIGEDHQKLLATFLVGADLVKFGGVRLSVAECDASMSDARRFVQESTPRAVTAPQPELEGAAT